MNARAAILARLASAAPGSLPALPDTSDWMALARTQGDDRTRLSRVLVERLTSYRAEVHEVTLTDWHTRVREVLRSKGVHRLLVGSGAAHGDLLADSAAPDVKVLRYERAIELWRDELFEQVDAAFTSAQGAVADTGSLILWPTASEPRLMSLVPPVHCVLLDEQTIYPDLAQAMHAQSWSQGMPTNALLISGPSKTADIQQTLAYGAHGPRELIVFLRRS